MERQTIIIKKKLKIKRHLLGWLWTKSDISESGENIEMIQIKW